MTARIRPRSRLRALVRCEREVRATLQSVAPLDIAPLAREIMLLEDHNGVVTAADKRPSLRSGRVALEGVVASESGSRVLVGRTAILGEIQVVLVVFWIPFIVTSVLMAAAVFLDSPPPCIAWFLWMAFGVFPVLAWLAVSTMSQESHDYLVREVVRTLR